MQACLMKHQMVQMPRCVPYEYSVYDVAVKNQCTRLLLRTKSIIINAGRSKEEEKEEYMSLE